MPVEAVVPKLDPVALAEVQTVRAVCKAPVRSKVPVMSRAPVEAVLTIAVERIKAAIASRGKKDALTVLTGHSVTFFAVLSCALLRPQTMRLSHASLLRPQPRERSDLIFPEFLKEELKTQAEAAATAAVVRSNVDTKGHSTVVGVVDPATTAKNTARTRGGTFRIRTRS